MSSNVMVLVEAEAGGVTDATVELIGKARELATAWGGAVEAVVLGPGEVGTGLGGADTVVRVEHPGLATYLPEAYENTLAELLVTRSPRLLMLANSTVGLDLGAALAVAWDAELVAYVIGLQTEGTTAVATAQILGGKILAEVGMAAERGVVTVVPGSFPAALGRVAGEPELVTVDAPGSLGSLRMRLERLVTPEGGDVDITAAPMLVSVGRGVGSADNIELAQEMADYLGATVSSSRPVVDAGWMPKSRQVGKSGLTVTPRAYLAFGISGAPEHLEGMRDSELIIACNTDENAPIFDVAHYGTTTDLFELLPALTGRLGG
ncbi:MAG: electron transfer flavoprotein subunit alpha/FixB family protein [Actinomycetes bacterium]